LYGFKRMKERMVPRDRNAEISDRIRAAGARAKAEAEARRAAEKPPRASEKETGGPKGPEPTRYGDWERKGLISDF
jgi:hypothetical protein